MKQLLVASVLAVMVLASCGTTRTASRNRAFLDRLEAGYRSEHYQQDSLMLVDPVGDACIIRKLDTIPTKIFMGLAGGLPQSEKSDRQEDFKIGKTLPFDNDRLLNKCREIMFRHYPDIVPTRGEEHKWSPEARQYIVYGFWHRLSRKLSGKQQDYPCPLFFHSKLLVCLACGWTARYCVTGREAALKEFILRCPDRSVQLHQVFEESYLLNRGDIYLTFLTCENVLAGMPHRPDRGNDPMQKKLAYIRNDSTEAGDNYGAWYHYFGAALYGLLRQDYVSRLVTDVESLGSFFMEGADRQETLINRSGALFGYEFQRMLELGTWWVAPLNAPTDYMMPRSKN